MIVTREESVVDMLRGRPNSVLVMLTPGLLDHLRFRQQALSEYLAGERFRLSRSVPGVDFVFGVTLFTAIVEAGKEAIPLSLDDWCASLSVEDFVVVAPGNLSLGRARMWATRSQSALIIKKYGDECQSCLPHGVLREAFLDRAARDRTARGGRRSEPIVNQENWQFLLLAASLRAALGGRVFVVSREDLDERLVHDRMDPYDVLCGKSATESLRDRAWAFLGLPDYLGDLDDSSVLLAQTVPLDPGTFIHAETECPSLTQAAGEYAVVDANLLGMGRVPDLLDHFNAQQLKCRILVPISVQLEVARKAIFGNDTALDQHRLWSDDAAADARGYARVDGDGNPLLAVPLQDQVTAWSRAMWDAAGPERLCALPLTESAISFLARRVWGRDTAGTADLMYAAAYLDLSRMPSQVVLAYTDDRALRALLEDERQLTAI